jgi:hypothetical protein
MLIKEYFYCSDAIHFDDVFDGKIPFENISKDKITDLEIKNILRIFVSMGHNKYIMLTLVPLR